MLGLERILARELPPACEPHNMWHLYFSIFSSQLSHEQDSPGLVISVLSPPNACCKPRSAWVIPPQTDLPAPQRCHSTDKHEPIPVRRMLMHKTNAIETSLALDDTVPAHQHCDGYQPPTILTKLSQLRPFLSCVQFNLENPACEESIPQKSLMSCQTLRLSRGTHQKRCRGTASRIPSPFSPNLSRPISRTVLGQGSCNRS
ncbi:hypothetical protein J3F83DRAFT_681687 [Trichoderma novae-zelandiae]